GACSNFRGARRGWFILHVATTATVPSGQARPQGIYSTGRKSLAASNPPRALRAFRPPRTLLGQLSGTAQPGSLGSISTPSTARDALRWGWSRLRTIVWHCGDRQNALSRASASSRGVRYGFFPEDPKLLPEEDFWPNVAALGSSVIAVLGSSVEFDGGSTSGV